MVLPGAESGVPTCPACRSERIELLGVGSGITHRCLDCGAEFDETGARVVL